METSRTGGTLECGSVEVFVCFVSKSVQKIKNFYVSYSLSPKATDNWYKYESYLPGRQVRILCKGDRGAEWYFRTCEECCDAVILPCFSILK